MSQARYHLAGFQSPTVRLRSIGVAIVAFVSALALNPRLSSVLIVLGAAAIYTWNRRVASQIPLVRRIAVLGFAIRITVALLQTRYGLFFPNADANIYALRGHQLVTYGYTQSHAWGFITLGQFGIISLNALSAWIPGSPSIELTTSLFAAAASQLAIIITYDAFYQDKAWRRLTTGLPAEIRYWQITMAVLALSPSLAIWGSQDLKEPFLMLGMALIAKGFTRSPRRDKPTLPAILIGLSIVLLFRPYIGALVAAVVAAITLIRGNSSRRPRVRVVAIIAALYLGIRTIGPHLVGLSLTQQRVNSIQAGGNSVSTTNLHGSLLSKTALVQLLFNPVPWQPPGSFAATAGYLEGLCIGVGLILCLATFLKSNNRMRNLSSLSNYAIITFTTVDIVYSLGLTNAGTIAREKAPALLLIAPILTIAMLSRMKQNRGFRAPGIYKGPHSMRKSLL